MKIVEQNKLEHIFAVLVAATSALLSNQKKRVYYIFIGSSRLNQYPLSRFVF